MKMIKLILPVVAVMLFSSCDNYFDINENPNDLHQDEAKPYMYLPSAQVGAFRVQATTMNRLGLLFSNAAGGNVQSYASPFNDEFNLNITTTFYAGIFEGIYLNANTFQKITEYPDADGKYAGYKAVAKICKAYYMQYLVDLYGDVPYTEAFKGQANLTPRYNDDQKVYQELLAELDAARAIISDIQNGVNANAEDISAYDVMLQGDLSKWEQFANTIELKMLVRMSNNTGAVAAWRDARLANLVPNFIQDDVKINPGYSASTDSQVNPQVLNFGYNSAGIVTNRNIYCISGHLAKSVNPYASINYGSPAEQEVIPGSGVFYPNVLDPRRFRLFATASSTQAFHKGVTQGSLSVDVYNPAGGSPIGQPSKFAGYFYNPYNEGGVNTIPTNPNTRVTWFAANSGYVMTLAEAHFIQAEAAILGGGYAVLGLDAEAHFDAGVNATMPFYQAAPGAYLATIKTKPNYGYSPAFTVQQNHHAIMYQKWIAVMQNNAIEAYIDNTRTGYPLNPMPLNVDASKPTRPKRLIYPNSEYIANANNVPNVTSTDIFASTSPSHPFWLLGDPVLGN